MGRPEFLRKYKIDWEILDVIVGGKSSLDSNFVITELNNKEKAYNFLENYGFDRNDPVMTAELFGNYQETLQFIRRYFLKEGNESGGLDLEIPKIFYSFTEVSDLFIVSMGNVGIYTEEEVLWGRIILKIMHTYVHIDKDLRHNYFSVVLQNLA